VCSGYCVETTVAKWGSGALVSMNANLASETLAIYVQNSDRHGATVWYMGRTCS
jgi:hypothetical protein